MGEAEDEVNVAHFLLDLDLLELDLLNNDAIVYCAPLGRLPESCYCLILSRILRARIFMSRI